jgi:RNA recognition motif-containing protein
LVRQVRLVAGKGVAFVEYLSEPQATVALTALQNYKIDNEHTITVQYARK